MLSIMIPFASYHVLPHLQAVMDRMRAVLDEEIFVHFRESAQKFREGDLSPAEYFDLFLGIFGEFTCSRTEIDINTTCMNIIFFSWC